MAGPVDARWHPVLTGPLVALAVIGSLAGLMAASVLVDWRHDGALRSEGFVVEATITSLDKPQGQITATYHDPTTGVAMVSTADLWDAELHPKVGDPVTLQVDPANPSRARVLGDHFPLIPLLAILSFMPAAFPVTLLVLRLRHARRAEALVAADVPTFQVLGRLVPAPFWRRGRPRCELHLFPLDDLCAEGRPLAVVPLLDGVLSTPAAPPLTIRAKGQLRPFGLVVASTVGYGILWPAGPARCPRRRAVP
jgi:hypothetical protein